MIAAREMETPVGLRFCPTDEEIVDDYLRPKNLETDTSRVDQVISTVTICSFDPWELPCQSRIKLKDKSWCFFSRKVNKYDRGEQQIRKTKSGFWKITGNPKAIMRNRVKIGAKKVLMFYFSKDSKSDWVMHEYHLLSPVQKMMTYTICKVMFKGEENEVSSPPLHLVNNSGGSEEEAHQLDDAATIATKEEEWKTWLNDNDDEETNIMFLQDNRNDYRPPKSLTGVFTDDIDSSDDNDSDFLSPATNSIGTSCTCDDSFGSSNHRIDQIKDLPEPPNSTVELVSPLTQEVSQALRTNVDTTEIKKMNPCDDARGTEIEDHKLGQEMIKKNKRAGNFFLRMVQKFVKKIRLCYPISRT
ncbi:PREDICTED: NAC domain-containing protein 3 isoform X2 [Camelina sativa]|uniref:NAC domain-containing protein 3 isoform X2 n=1 Tax=Camelina sativa TaxID=90675 RepID=A0ABM0WQD9_CAMSA|nr:PREDICTED: NAC domain-containing protein 3 isoform X2 [Camelina sativa]